MSPARPTIASLALLLLPALAAASVPAAPVRPVTDTYFGETITDPYRWLEDLKSTETIAWMKASSEAARKQLDAIPGRARLLERVKAFDAATPARAGFVQVTPDGKVFYFQRTPGEDFARLYVREGWNGPARVVFDPATRRKETGKAESISWYRASPSGARVAVATAASGSEQAVMHIVDTATGNHIGLPLANVGLRAPNWLDDERFVLHRNPDLPPDAAPSDRWLHGQAWLMRVGAPAEEARIVFGTKAAGAGDMAPPDFPFVELSDASPWAIGLAAGARSTVGVYVARKDQLGTPALRWRKLYSPEDSVQWAQARGDTLYVLTTRDAPRGRILAVPLAGDGAQRVVYEGERVIDLMGVAKDALYFRERDGVYERLMRVAFDGGAASEIRFDARGSYIATGDGDKLLASPDVDGVVVSHGTWTRPDVLFRAVPGQSTAVDTTLAARAVGVDLGMAVVEDLEAVSHDGVKVPLSLVRPANAKRDGNNRVLLEGYGSYGQSSTPFLPTAQLAWTEAGIARATCHVRGGGELGSAWHEGGRLANKANTWRDFIACAEALVAIGYTKPALITGTGTSAGGIMVANAMVERPELFGAIIDDVGVTDTLRLVASSQNGPNHYFEYGDPRTPEGYRVLRDASAYLKLRDGVRYPSTLIMHGVNDPRVDVWVSTKFAARLAAASPNPVLLRLDDQAGHGIGTAASSRLQEKADWIAFVLWATGHPDYQP
jgi:prolyl oligopeptidase